MFTFHTSVNKDIKNAFPYSWEVPATRLSAPRPAPDTTGAEALRCSPTGMAASSPRAPWRIHEEGRRAKHDLLGEGDEQSGEGKMGTLRGSSRRSPCELKSAGRPSSGIAGKEALRRLGRALPILFALCLAGCSSSPPRVNPAGDGEPVSGSLSDRLAAARGVLAQEALDLEERLQRALSLLEEARSLAPATTAERREFLTWKWHAESDPPGRRRLTHPEPGFGRPLSVTKPQQSRRPGPRHADEGVDDPAGEDSHPHAPGPDLVPLCHRRPLRLTLFPAASRPPWHGVTGRSPASASRRKDFACGLPGPTFPRLPRHGLRPRRAGAGHRCGWGPGLRRRRALGGRG